MSTPLVIIDAGHGINTAGKRSPFTRSQLRAWLQAYGDPSIRPLTTGEGIASDNGGAAVREYLFARTLARRLRDELCGMGYDARLLVEGNDDMPLRDRLMRVRTLVNDHRKGHGIAAERVLVSLHANASGLPMTRQTLAEQGADAALRPRGWEVWTAAGDQAGAALGGNMLRYACQQLPSDIPVRTAVGNARTIVAGGHQPTAAHVRKTTDIYLLKNAPCAAVLTENLFMDSPLDAAYLLSPDALDALTRLHALAIDDYFYLRQG